MGEEVDPQYDGRELTLAGLAQKRVHVIDCAGNSIQIRSSRLARSSCHRLHQLLEGRVLSKLAKTQPGNDCNSLASEAQVGAEESKRINAGFLADDICQTL